MKTKHGTVYALRGGRFVKIGFTTNLLQRVDMIARYLPFRVRLVLAEDGTEEDEHHLHAVLAQFRVRREWFKWSPTVDWVLRYVKQKRLANVMVTGRHLVDLLKGLPESTGNNAELWN